MFGIFIMDNNLISCRDIIVSEDYADFIEEYEIPSREVMERLGGVCYQSIDINYSCVYVPNDKMKELSLENYKYSSIPTLYGLMDTVALEETGVLKLQNQPLLNLKGQGVIVGIIDTGIDYTHEAFRNDAGETRILKIWDQSDNSGNIPDGFGYGSEYTSSDINKALNSENPLKIVPVTDEIGHGTFVAGVACGSENIGEDFVGVAPESEIVVVKLKRAKQYLKDYYMLPADAIAYQENDIMLALGYMREQARQFNMPLSIVLGVGSNRGGHIGKSPLSFSIEDFTRMAKSAISIAAGNEADKRHHYHGMINNGEEKVEIGEDVSGFTFEAWTRNPNIISIGFESPSGEVIPKIPATLGANQRIYTVFDDTVIEVEYAFAEQLSGDEVIVLRFINPSPGIWTINIYGENYDESYFDIWLSISGFIDENTFFLEPEPDGTITTPGDTMSAITLSSYNEKSGSIANDSSRGFLPNGLIKPDLSVPGVGVFGPVRGGSYGYRSGTSISAAISAGVAAQLLGWGVNNVEYRALGNQIIKSYLVRGAIRDDDKKYPDTRLGWGKMNVYNSFTFLT